MSGRARQVLALVALLALAPPGAGTRAGEPLPAEAPAPAGGEALELPPPPGFGTLPFFAGQAWARPLPAGEVAADVADTPEDMVRRGYGREVAGDLPGACREYWQVHIRQPGTGAAGVALQRLAKCLFDGGDPMRAALAMELARREYPDSVDPKVVDASQLSIAHHLVNQALAWAARPDGAAAARLALEQGRWLYRSLYERGDDAAPETGRDAGLGLGLASLYLFDTGMAEAAFGAVAEEFPDTDAAKRAAALLQVARRVAANGQDGQGETPRLPVVDEWVQLALRGVAE